MNRASLRVGAVVALALITLVALVLVKNPFRRKTVVRAYFADAMSLRAGAPVRLAGIDIGSVQSVRARPELKETPAEVVMLLTPSYELTIPSDSTASLETAGVLGQTYVEIDVGHATGPPLESNAVLKAASTPQISAQEFIQKVGDILSRRCDCASGKTNNAEEATIHKNTSKSRSQPPN